MGKQCNFGFWYRTAFGGLLLPLVLAGCGGSHSSSDSAFTPAATVPAIIVQYGTGPYDYTISLLPSGSATYSPSSSATAALTKTGTVPAAMTNQFFKDLEAAMPVQNLPLFTGTNSAIAAGETVQYQGQAGHIDDPNDAREQALATDAAAIARVLGLPHP